MSCGQLLKNSIRVSRGRRLMLKQKLFGAKLQAGKRMEEFFQEVKQLQCQLDIKVDITLNALPKSYDPHPVNISIRAGYGPVLFVNLEALLLQEQERVQCRHMA